LPAVGALLGFLAGCAGWAASIVLPRPFPAVVAFGALALLTGAIHLDGFLDGCDAFGASVPAARRLEILKDPRHGTFAVVGFYVAATFALAALAAMAPPRLPAALAFACAAARAASVSGAFVFPGVRSGANVPHFARNPPVLAVLAASIAAIAAAGYWLTPWAPALVPAALGAALACEFWIAGRLGGLVGDAYGFTIVVVEVGLLAALAALLWRA
jgi:adenosylcobinamide-GDP ribazoletransferase